MKNPNSCGSKEEEEEPQQPGPGRQHRLVDLIACLAVILAGLTTQSYLSALSQLRAYREENLNVTGSLDQEGLVFNRVPKVGSETIWSLIGKYTKNDERGHLICNFRAVSSI